MIDLGGIQPRIDHFRSQRAAIDQKRSIWPRKRSISIMIDHVKIDPLTPNRAVLEELGRRLETVRKQQGLTQEALAEQAGIGVATLRRIEDGNDARIGSWIRLLRAMGRSTSVDALLPESFRSPMQDVRDRGSGRRAPRSSGGFVWGDEAS